MKKVIRLFRLFFFMFASSLSSWNISAESIVEKSKNKPIKWIEEGIDADFAHFEAGFSSEDITNCLEKIRQMKDVDPTGIVRIYFQDGYASYAPLAPLKPELESRLEGFLSALRELNAILPLPNLDFVFSLSHNCNRPLLRKETTVPILAVSKEEHHPKIVLIPKLWDPNREENLFTLSTTPWEKKRELAIWRGSTNDGPYGIYDWDFKSRARLCLLSRQHRELLDACFSSATQMQGTLKNNRLVAPYITPSEQTENKYLISLDGTSASSSLEWQLFSGSLIFKSSSNKVQWFYRGLVPGEHFISFHPDSSNLIEKIFWAKNHQDEGSVIALSAYKFAYNTLRDESLFLYLHFVLNKYAELYCENAP